jgi:hypothetical protein
MKHQVDGSNGGILKPRRSIGALLAVLSLCAAASTALGAPRNATGVICRSITEIALAQTTPQDPKPVMDEAERERIRKMARDNAAQTLKEIRELGSKPPERVVDIDVADPEDLEVNAQPEPTPASDEKVEGPHIVFDQSVHDFGLVMDKQELKCTFTFRNAGTQTLIVEKVNTGCGCTVANMPKQQFAPGETGSIEITYNPKGTGSQNRSIQVMTNDAKQRVTTVALNAHVLPLIEARPSTVQFGQVVCGQERKVEVVIVSRDPNMKIDSITTNGPEVTAKELPDREPVQLIEKDLPGRKVIEVTLSPDAPPGRVLKMITIQATAAKSDGKPEQHTLNVNAFAAIKGELSVQPPFIRVRPLAVNEPFDREAIITREGGQPFKILDTKILNSTLEGVTASVEPYENGAAKGYKIVIRGKAGDTAKSFRGSVEVTTDMPKEPTVEIQFSGLVRPPVLPGTAN